MSDIRIKILRKYRLPNDPDILAELENGNWLWLLTDTDGPEYVGVAGWDPSRHSDTISCALETGPFWTADDCTVSTQSDLPKNNDGLDQCVFCGAPTRTTGGYFYGHDYRICTECGK